MKKLIRTPDAVGLDEAGRGPLAGPVFAGAVLLPARFRCPGLDDSKKLDAKTRERLAERIRDGAIWAVASANVEEIDTLNILHASMEAMRRAVMGLPITPRLALVDGNRIPPGLPCAAEPIVDGDAKVAAIAAASILAKTERDRFMREAAERYPGYGFERHFGYATPEHLEALRELGPCPLHRMSFAPCRASEQLCLTFAE